MDAMNPVALFELGPLTITDTVVVSAGLTAFLVLVLGAAMRVPRLRASLEVVYEMLEDMLQEMVTVDVTPIVPLILAQWLYILAANLVGLLPIVSSPTRDLSLTAALAVVAFGAGHVYGFRAHGWRYLRSYLQPNPILLPFNIIGELSRTLALALRLFGNVASGELVGAIVVSLAGLLVPVPLMALSLLTSVVQAYIFGVLTLVFTASAMQVAGERHPTPAPETP